MIDAKKTMSKLKGESEKGNRTLYFTNSIFEEFKAYCGTYSASEVLEQLMKEFIESAKKSGMKPSRAKASKKN